jgi:N6-adenosine-specific RNA methylase IME4
VNRVEAVAGGSFHAGWVSGATTISSRLFVPEHVVPAPRVVRARALIADPPWKTRDRLGKRGAAAKYKVMDLFDIARFRLPVMYDDSYLFLWRLAAMSEEALLVVRAWGFTPKAELVWNKLTRRGKVWFGQGHHTRGAHETCIIATRGKAHPRFHNIRSTFSAVVPSERNKKTGRLEYIHSRKPDEFYAIVRKLTGTPRVELFSRVERRGFVGYGDQHPGGRAHP